MDSSEMHNNVILIYQYTEKEIEGFNKSIDNLVSKLTAALGFSGVALKLIADLPNDGTHFWIRLLSGILLFLSIGSCVAGLWAQDSGAVIRAKALLRKEYPIYYSMTEEQYRLCIIRQWHEHIKSLEDLLDKRRRYLNISIGLLATVGFFYMLGIITSSIR
uniref:Uncharacterized protein n=1 Tax=Cyanothece sp. (strain PCC 7425 / ATCC 29141) TaxID=395961 RepID=B8HMZ0_CYAP4